MSQPDWKSDVRHDPSVESARLRVFEMSFAGSRALLVDLPTDWAKPCGKVEVIFRETDGLGWHLAVTADGGQILSFPWHDSVDELLRSSPTRFPVSADETWEDLDQGWWASVVPCDDDVYLAESDLDALFSVTDSTPALVRLGLVEVGGVPVTWHRVDKSEYARAWATAIETCRSGGPPNA
jgi:hypothetical protein